MPTHWTRSLVARGRHQLWSPRHLINTIVERGVGEVAVRVAPAWRRHLERIGRVRVIGITGSAGKTSTTRLLAACLRTAGAVSHTERLVGRLNSAQAAARLVLATRGSHRFCLYEIGVGGPGTMRPFLDVVQPHIGVVINIAGDHYSAFRSLDETAREKGQLIESLPDHGVAVLNLDDPRVAAMRSATRARVLTYGLSASDADVRGADVSAAWPDRLSLTVRHGADAVRVQTRLAGAHFAHPVLAAMATALAAGIPLATAARAIAAVEPADGRCSVHDAAGVTFIRDDWKAPFWSMDAAIRFMEAARARRRVMIIGTISDYPGASSPKYRAVARQAAAAVDEVIFVGPTGHRTHMDDLRDRVRSFETLAELQAYLERSLQPGDLVMLKGSAKADHLQRIVLARDGGVACWRRSCGRTVFCASCDLRFKPESPAPVGLLPV